MSTWPVLSVITFLPLVGAALIFFVRGSEEVVGEAMAARWGLMPGDRIALHEYLPCWRCHWCLQGDFRLCMEADFFNLKDRFNTLRYGTCNANIPPHLWGGFAQKKLALIDAERHVVVQSAHPSPLSAKKFFGSKPFSKVNAALEKFGQPPIDWRLPPTVSDDSPAG